MQHSCLYIPSIREGIEEWYDERSYQFTPVENAIDWLKKDGYIVPAIATRHDVVCLCEAVNLAAKFDPSYYDIKAKLVAFTFHNYEVDGGWGHWGCF